MTRAYSSSCSGVHPISIDEPFLRRMCGTDTGALRSRADPTTLSWRTHIAVGTVEQDDAANGCTHGETRSRR
jgi:hypothetical protein